MTIMKSNGSKIFAQLTAGAFFGSILGIAMLILVALGEQTLWRSQLGYLTTAAGSNIRLIYASASVIIGIVLGAFAGIYIANKVRNFFRTALLFLAGLLVFAIILSFAGFLFSAGEYPNAGIMSLGFAGYVLIPALISVIPSLIIIRFTSRHGKV